MDLAERIAALGLRLPEVPAALGSYVPARAEGNLIYTAGQLPLRDGALLAAGLVGDEVDLETAVECARQATLNGIAAAATAAGALADLTGVLRVCGYVASAPGFAQQPQVLNGASDLLVDVFGDAGRHVRAAIGVGALPMNAPIEIEFVFTTDGR